MTSIVSRSRLDAVVSIFVPVHPHETSALLHSSTCFFFVKPHPTNHRFLLTFCRSDELGFLNFLTIFVLSWQILSAYFVVLPLRDEGAISLGLSKLPGLFMGSLALTLIAAPLSTLVFSMPNLSKAKVMNFP